MKRYIFVADEMGAPGMAPGTSDTFVFGGYVVAERNVPSVIQIWRTIKANLCGNAEVELKWKHFFVDFEDPVISNPLLETDRRRRRRLAIESLDRLFNNAPITPLIAISQKHRATESLIVPSRKGKDKIDYDVLWMGPIALFALFLSVHKARGKLWFDRLGSEKHEERWQQAWSEQLQLARNKQYPPQLGNNLRKILAIDEQIEFLDSKGNEAVQIADFVCGVIWAAGEGDEVFLARLVDKYGPNATRQGLGILHIE